MEVIVIETFVRFQLDSQVLLNGPQLAWFGGEVGALHKVHQKSPYFPVYRVVQPRAMVIALCLLNNGDRVHLRLMSY